MHRSDAPWRKPNRGSGSKFRHATRGALVYSASLPDFPLRREWPVRLKLRYRPCFPASRDTLWTHRFLAIGPRYPGVLSDDGMVVLFTHLGDAQWTEILCMGFRGER